MKADTVPAHLQAVINSGIIYDYSIQYRNTKPDDGQFNGDVEFDKFKMFYLSKLWLVKFPEENNLAELDVYPSSKTLKADITARKKQLLVVYKKELEIELRKEILKRYYQFAKSGQLGFEQSVMYNFLKTL